MPNPLALLALAIWPLVTVVLFQKLPPGRAVLTTLIAGYLFLPEPPAGFDFPLLPPLTKHTIPALSAFVMWYRMYPQNFNPLPRSPVAVGLLLLFMFSPIVTALFNMQPVYWGNFTIQGMTIKDSIGIVIQQCLLALPFLLARRFLKTAEDQRDLLIALLIGGLVYSVPMLIEIRLSPQLNLWVYGYYQHDFSQTMRFGGFRPMVFLNHGIWAAFFLLMSIVATFALWKYGNFKRKWAILGAALYLTAVLVLAKSLGAWLFAAALIPTIIVFSARWQMRLALCIALFAITYPAMKGIGLVPEAQILEAAASIDPDRAASLEFRFTNENRLLERAQAKPLFGWGNYDRNQIMNPANGVIETITDGRWIILIGQLGWLGFLAEFGLLLLPVFLLWRETRHRSVDSYSLLLAPLALLLSVNVFDLLPNATLTPLTWLMAGALLGYAETLRDGRKEFQSDQRLQWRPVI
ncbi:hypothetical protein [uncultured Marivita sp.]|uniref:hypothetical protein n=1 Tax=uncultured Marivita sp. TaxID=888080 RepID=UPI0025D79F6A|nr:hypothetical protein [uncultured Marivita sp.]